MQLSENSNDKVVELLEANIERIDWISLSANTNPKVIHILEKNQDKINWTYLSSNSIIFELDYQKMSIDKINIILKDLMVKCWHPLRIIKMLEQGIVIEDIFC